ncbi:MAG: RICIN domain-containing protein [Candidatus Bipolaricaulis sp.]|nr:RICIN domain-containing protein [Candidatus Bipolaricaulis sp.]
MRFRPFWSFVAAGLLASGLAVAGCAQFVILDAPFSADAAQFYRITAEHSAKCLDIDGDPMIDGARVVQRDWLAVSSQLWRILPVGEESYRIVNLRSAKCLTVADSTAQQRACLGEAVEEWRIEPAGERGYRIVNIVSGQCLGVSEASLTDGAHVESLDCAGAPHQLWRIEAAMEQAFDNRSGSDIVVSGLLSGLAYLGMTCETATGPGVVVAVVAAGSPADLGDLRVGDIILSIDGQTIISCADVEQLMATKKPGETIIVQVMRGTASTLLTVELG